LAKDRPTIVLFAHPECPCTKATLHQLEEAQAKATRKASIYIVFATPEGLPVGDGSQVLIKQARQIKGATVIEDDGLALAKRFGATTSGQTFVFDPGSTLLFKGGLTRARGHYGNSLGAESLLSMMDTGKPVATETPVYGCSLGL
jgi:hypothetical protein